jgi:transcriptional regulator with XRE-family HTH domain
MPLPNEKQAFADRLKIALKRQKKSIETATALAHEFNLRHPNEPITAQAAQKWLTGKAKPTADKLETLADWLGVSSHWLRNGPPPEPKKKATAGARKGAGSGAGGLAGLTDKEASILGRLRTLSEHQVYLIAELVDQLAVEREVNGGSDGG